MSGLVSAHGGVLVDRFVPEHDVLAERQRAARFPRIELDGRELADLELIATGAASPLTGFLGAEDYGSVLERMRLADGTLWPVPLTLAVDDAVRQSLEGAGEAALVDASGNLWATIRIAEIFRRDPAIEARAVYGTEDPSHPGVAYLVARPRWLVAGSVRVFPLPANLPFAHYRLTPRALRAVIASRGWRRVAGFQTRNPIHRAHEYLTKLALDVTDGLVIHPLVGETKADDVPADVRFRVYEALIGRYYPEERTVLAAFPAAMRYAGPREALFHVLVRKNYGITHLIIGRDHAGVGRFYTPFAAHALLDTIDPGELGVTPLRMDASFFCRICDAFATGRTCPHDASGRVELSGSKVREILQNGGGLPCEFTRPEVAQILREHYSGVSTADEAGARGHGGAPDGTSVARRGFILWLTGLSGAGKSTIARALRDGLAAGRPVEILDGDDVRTWLSNGLGFSKADRDANIRRIGHVARLLARHGVGVIAAAISPYAAVRDEVRRLAQEEHVPFIEVFVEAKLDTLIERDVKGLYRKALAGELPHFTGVTDPYEPPPHPDITVRTDHESVDASVRTIVDVLRERDLLPHVAVPVRNLALAGQFRES